MLCEEDFVEHQRVESTIPAGMRGTVRYFGKVEHSPDEGTYVGVQWDGKYKGKYDGEIFGVRYFQAPKMSSSFVKPIKLKVGGDLCHFLKTKYTLAEQHTRNLANLSDGEKPTKGLTNVISYQSVFRDDAGRFTNIRNVSASGSLTSRCGNVGHFFPNLTDLSLSFTLISEWKEVFLILNALKSLEALSLSGNKMQPLSAYLNSEEEVEDQLTFPTVTSLTLTSMNIEWDAVRYLMKKLPSLEELNCSDNDHTSTPLDATVAPKLSRLRLDNNDISCWETVSSNLRGVESLQFLHLSENPIKSIVTTNEDTLQLKGLYLRKTNLSSWDDVDNLSLLKLEELCLSGCPLTNILKEHERRCLVTARIPTLLTLNRGTITSSERIDCERFLVRYYHGAVNVPKIWNQLVEVHGNLLPLADVDISPKLTAAITVKYVYPSQTDESPFVVNVKQTVQKLTQSLCAPFGLNTKNVTLVMVDPEVAGTPIERTDLDKPSRMLYTYRLKDGDVIELHVKE
eukprot:TRINITY_DN1363_c0_g1_i1.p1 TRINITY_DN1363_c0_g1~~TRINITY_DN1363_c0_g1_i1.p1  ORF type:complete len:531 (+),score=75.09 TRINITY_DN1363_c0_g1_i1:60-1595(+)